MPATYNEIDPFAARWLRGLIAAGHIAPGVVDERSIEALAADDVRGHGQRHFFAGIAGWSLALRLAGVPDDADVWTGSCPCQGFSDAGRRRGFDDERHLWPAWFRLIRECRPPVVFGEQVASNLGRAWLDLVFADMEGAGYACAAADLPAAGIGAPHRRQRLFFVAYADGQSGRLLAAQRQSGRADAQAERRGEALGLADSGSPGPQDGRHGRSAVDGCAARGMAHTRQDEWRPARTSGPEREDAAKRHEGPVHDQPRGGDSNMADSARGRWAARQHVGEASAGERSRSADGGWSDCTWIPCADGVSRPAEPGTHPLAHGVPGRVGLLRGYGNAIVPQVAAAFIRAALEDLDAA